MWTKMERELLSRISAVLPRLAAKIVHDQEPDGGFKSLSSSDEGFANAIEYRTTFFPALIAACISGQADPVLEPTKNKLTGFLLAQKGGQSSFNYWDRSSREFTEKPYPDDLDDTFCALGALAALRPSAITGEVLAGAVTLLAAAEVEPGGPYRTWLVAPDAPPVWQDVDLAVNCNIFWFLAGQKVNLPALTTFIEDHIRRSSFYSPYYPSGFPILYYLSRGYKGPLAGKAIRFLLNQKTVLDTWGNGLNTALAVCALLRLGFDPGKLEQPVEMLLGLCEAGKFSPQPFCFDPVIKGQKYTAGAEALTAAMYLEALTLYRETVSAKKSPGIPASRKSELENKVYAASVSLVRQRFSGLVESMQVQGNKALDFMLAKDAADQQVVLLPCFFADACKERDKFNQEFLARLGAAGLYGWIAYTIYDDIMDEARETELLPLANICLRETIIIYNTLEIGFQPVFERVIDKMESANAWELANTRTTATDSLPDYGDYGILADKSLGHILGPLAVVYKLGFKAASSPELLATERLFRDYLIARQLNDDAHDWQNDLQKGQVNSVAALILRDWRKQQTGKTESADFGLILPDLQRLFWNETIHEVGRLILRHTGEARQQAGQLEFLENHVFLETILEPLERAVSKAETESAKAADFLRSYRPA
jgi:hypothetical protein